MATKLLALLFGLIFLVNPIWADGEPLKVYILAGQSNMQGHAQVRTFEHLGMDEATRPILEAMTNADGSPATCTQVWISSIGHDGGEEERHGKLTADFGAAGGEPKIGPEFTFGIYAQKSVQQPVLIIKTAWGGKSLNTDFRSPGAGPYQFNDAQLQRFKSQEKDVEKITADKIAATGKYYRLMIDHVKKVLEDVDRVCPTYDAKAGYELAGFVWFQGWNDMVDSGTYPERDKPGGYDQYSQLLAHFIRDVRKDLETPELPFVIGVMGVGGPVEKYGPDQQRYRTTHSEFRNAMAAPASMPEFAGNVSAVFTENYWDSELGELASRWDKVRSEKRKLQKNKTLGKEELKKAVEAYTAELFTPEELNVFQSGTSNAAYHYLGSAKIMARIGKAFADSINAMAK